MPLNTRNLAGYWTLMLEQPQSSFSLSSTQPLITYMASKGDSAVQSSFKSFFESQAIEEKEKRKYFLLDRKDFSKESIPTFQQQLANLKKPVAPSSEECCMSGCAVCVWDLYEESFQEYKSKKNILQNAIAQLQDGSCSLIMEKDDEKEEIDPSIKAFRDMERNLQMKD